MAFSNDGTFVAFGLPDGAVWLRPVDYHDFAVAACARVLRYPPVFTAADLKLFSIPDSRPPCPVQN